MGRSSPNPALLSFDEASALIAACAARLGPSRLSESVALLRARGRILSQALRADSDQPSFARSTRDGFACRATEASKYLSLTVAGLTRAGDPPSGPLPRSAVWEIMTGAPVPHGADAVIMLEHVETSGTGASRTIRLLPPRAARKGENIVARGAQACKGDELLPVGTAIDAAQIGLAGFCGASTLKVFARPRVAILATGDELVSISQRPAPGHIRNSSSAMLAAMVAAAGGEPWVLPTARDNAKSLDAALAHAASADLLLITGGVSAGKYDLVEPALARAGARFHFTGVRIQPGKPLVFAELPAKRTKSVQKIRRVQCFGLPGNPVSSAVTFLLFAAPVLAALAGRSARSPSFVHGPRFALASLSEEVKTKPGLTRFLPAACTFTGPVPQVMRVPWEGSGDLAAMAHANCFLVVPEDASHLRAGDTVRILLI
jgi:molybdopterin molybdotransferase